MRSYQLNTKVPTDFDTPLLGFNNQGDVWTLRDAVRGVQIFGGIGSGKTSGSGRMIAKAFLEFGLGGLVLCAKTDERANWEAMAKETGRTNDLIIFREGDKWRFNPLDYETIREGEGRGESFNLVNLFMNIYQMGRNINGEGMSKESERFWDNALKRCLRRMIDLLKLSDEKVSVGNMHRLIISTLYGDELQRLRNIMADEDKDRAYEQLQKWSENNYYIKCLLKSMSYLIQVRQDKPETYSKVERDFHLVKNYFEREFASLHERTRTIVIESFLGIAEPFLSGLLYEYFAQDTTIYPEWTFQKQSVIIMDMPIKKYLDAGVYAQGIFKLLWQQAIERREFKIGEVPIFLWVDESQMFLNDYDQTFQTTARSSGACTVFLSQNISNYYAAIGGKDPKPKVDSLLANLSTKIFHANNDAVTNEWAANTIGRDTIISTSYNIGREESFGGSQQYQYLVKPIEFTKLRTGGKVNGSMVDAYITVAGKEWASKKNYLLANIPQNI